MINLRCGQGDQDRADVSDYIAADNPLAAAHIEELFSDAAARLVDHTKLGRPGKIQGTRELVPDESYRLMYGISGEAVWMPTLAHTARQWSLVRD
ncbi:type II toxin-antitoxin system RelE/ParE family toxin [Glaciimonas immobilis]|uniref:Addiction module RelE/StbE family toxin n=1 Tax=Glaciimonas immobilis TaxID=728004 RepID=A0A840RS10_9BURK|nr:type II toxin-antitoxin system RelE/ParE family toxin [Glaciimonas immobilis]KAF3996922.1 type II toxin-antitoxin system RelE/ParE family toxin [Glaciimonas immobilis]MBB5199746.1 addiction module RelE/StbE family toxin [Glaciimonas immobilis]